MPAGCDCRRNESLTLSITRPWHILKVPFQPLSVEEDQDFSMAAPVVTKLNQPETLLIQWEAVEEDIYGFELQFRQNRGGQPWITVSDSLTSNQIRKRNLKCKWGYQFRVRPATDHKNEPFSPPSQPMAALGVKSPFPAILMKGLSTQQQQAPPPEQQYRPRPQPGRSAPPQQQYEEEYEGEYYGEEEPFVMDPPWFNKAEEPNALMVCWTPVEYATGYELQMIKCMKKKAAWTTIAPNLQGSQVKKKNLTSKAGYQFRVRPNGFEEEMEFSPPSNIASAN